MFHRVNRDTDGGPAVADTVAEFLGRSRFVYAGQSCLVTVQPDVFGLVQHLLSLQVVWSLARLPVHPLVREPAENRVTKSRPVGKMT